MRSIFEPVCIKVVQLVSDQVKAVNVVTKKYPKVLSREHVFSGG